VDHRGCQDGVRIQGAEGDFLIRDANPATGCVESKTVPLGALEEVDIHVLEVQGVRKRESASLDPVSRMRAMCCGVPKPSEGREESVEEEQAERSRHTADGEEERR